jgi:hypothetical protein
MLLVARAGTLKYLFNSIDSTRTLGEPAELLLNHRSALDHVNRMLVSPAIILT